MHFFIQIHLNSENVPELFSFWEDKKGSCAAFSLKKLNPNEFVQLNKSLYQFTKSPHWDLWKL